MRMTLHGSMRAEHRGRRFRTYNEQLCDALLRFTGDHACDADHRYVFMCECPADGCVESIELTLAEYRRARGDGACSLVAPEHAEAQMPPECVESHDRFQIVRHR